LDFNSASLLNQQCTDRHVASIGHNNLFRVNQSFLLHLTAAWESEKQQILI
jgi:hypothetical protein